MDHIKIIRSVCLFAQFPCQDSVKRLKAIAAKLREAGYYIQTLRLCYPGFGLYNVLGKLDPNLLYSIGTITLNEANRNMKKLLNEYNVSFNIDLTEQPPTQDHVNFLLNLIRNKASKSFNFTFVMNNRPSSPYFPSSSYREEGFAIGLQPTNLATQCVSVDEWMHEMKTCWDEIHSLFSREDDFLGIDSSIAPLQNENGSLIYFMNRLGLAFHATVLTPFYTNLTRFLKSENPKPMGLCGLMLPCLEDFHLAEEYSNGNFSMERNIYLSMHSGLGVDTYPLGMDEDPAIILNVLLLLRELSIKYNKPLSARFVSDGQAKIGDKTSLGSPYLKDVVIHPLLIS